MPIKIVFITFESGRNWSRCIAITNRVENWFSQIVSHERTQTKLYGYCGYYWMHKLEKSLVRYWQNRTFTYTDFRQHFQHTVELTCVCLPIWLQVSECVCVSACWYMCVRMWTSECIEVSALCQLRLLIHAKQFKHCLAVTVIGRKNIIYRRVVFFVTFSPFVYFFRFDILFAQSLRI